MAKWVRVAGTADVPEGQGLEVMADDQVVALFHAGGEYYALDGICPHAGGPLGEGQLQGSIVTCPWHGWQFDVSTGTHCLNRNLTHRSYRVKVEGDGVFVELP